eukprot:gb/GFBE01052961.1/.p1 GENE.gb/GFBE01052961.1/~~gb/GFBE01052961.1/.p1  ORF type:complete len:117 (+),score=11.44 gb/GFBE01052961.1/:1-351(+)
MLRAIDTNSNDSLGSKSSRAFETKQSPEASDPQASALPADARHQSPTMTDDLLPDAGEFLRGPMSSVVAGRAPSEEEWDAAWHTKSAWQAGSGELGSRGVSGVQRCESEAREWESM